ncbi:hypothetical protein CDL12_08816 [Handroanthus impetiginosus]|uniref:WRKY domain-containing protein n=1 Tax=Handroanthus impetiginosus TaxID=429701 RepID=A0A2G9G5F8_9LAMI|nr:hypothetical protein CDL12_27345 [Handroanthus impetiginosus]PIN18511.1 hypothetical protein CDL12_08816 [Handroanthus impetiginosus]
MEEENNRSSGALQDTENESSRLSSGGQEEKVGEKVEKNEEQRRVCSGSSNDCGVGNSSRGETKASDSETLASVQVSEGEFQADFDESSHVLSEVPVEFSLQPLLPAEELKDQGRTAHEESPKDVTGQSSQVQKQHQVPLPDGSSELELSPTSVTKSNSSIPSRTLPEQKLQTVKNGNNDCLTNRDKQNSSNPKPSSVVSMLKNPDGYNWRKYGQKQVKSPEGSRSYYRCTFSDCYAKKIECCDNSNHLTETVYRGPHNHDPPNKLNCTRENRPALPIMPVNGKNDTSHPVGGVNGPVPSAPSREPILGIDEVSETKQQESSGSESDDTVEINMKEESADGPECKNRPKRNSTGELEALSKPGKKPKYVVHAAGNVGISGDGYRWRKYGQKMVKGNPHPRNYYRCTSAGCPVRKHIEKAMDNTGEVVITYMGVHDHDKPVPKKRHGPKNTHLVASSPLSADNLHSNTKTHKSKTERSVDNEGELTGEALNICKEKASDSARAVLSIGFEIKPC